MREMANACSKFRSRENKLDYSLSSCWVLGWSPLTQRIDLPPQSTDTHTDHLPKPSLCLLSRYSLASLACVSPQGPTLPPNHTGHHSWDTGDSFIQSDMRGSLFLTWVQAEPRPTTGRGYYNSKNTARHSWTQPPSWEWFCRGTLVTDSTMESISFEEKRYEDCAA